MSQRPQLDVIAIGDVVIDDFVKLDEDMAWVEEKDGKKILSMEFGTKLPFSGNQVINAVGNASNSAVCFSRLGLKTGFVTNVGDDQRGVDIIRQLKNEKVDTRFVHENPNMQSNYHYVLCYKEERTILIKHEEYDYEWPRFRSNDIPRWMYFSSIAENAIEHYHDDVVEWLKENPDVKLAFQPGTYQMNAGIERLHELYARSEVVALNREEACMVFNANHEDIHDQFNKMHEAGVKIALITDGPNGAYASDGNKRWSMPLYPDPAPPVDRTGAGDSFATTFTAALMKGADVPSALLWAPINSMNVVQHVGAQEGLLSEDQIDYYLRNAPSNYHPTEM
jgi:sugar/nucleoside kinase (ribokinase family)